MCSGADSAVLYLLTAHIPTAVTLVSALMVMYSRLSIFFLSLFTSHYNSAILYTGDKRPIHLRRFAKSSLPPSSSPNTAMNAMNVSFTGRYHKGGMGGIDYSSASTLVDGDVIRGLQTIGEMCRRHHRNCKLGHVLL